MNYSEGKRLTLSLSDPDALTGEEQKSIVAIKEKLKCKKICIDAQKHAVGFYKKFGFRVSSDDFLEEGIVHQKMELCTHF